MNGPQFFSGRSFDRHFEAGKRKSTGLPRSNIRTRLKTVGESFVQRARQAVLPYASSRLMDAHARRRTGRCPRTTAFFRGKIVVKGFMIIQMVASEIRENRHRKGAAPTSGPGREHASWLRARHECRRRGPLSARKFCRSSDSGVVWIAGRDFAPPDGTRSCLINRPSQPAARRIESTR